MWEVFVYLAVSKKLEELSAAASQAAHSVSNSAQAALTPLYNFTAQATRRVLPLPEPRSRTEWKYGIYTHFVTQEEPALERQRLYNLELFFQYPENVARLTYQHILCALHHPGVGLDLIVIHQVKIPEDLKEYLIMNYNDVTGQQRDRLYDTIEPLVKKNPAMLNSIDAQLKDPTSTLRLVLEDHRNPVTRTLSSDKPDTLTRLNYLIRHLKYQRMTTPPPKQ